MFYVKRDASDNVIECKSLGEFPPEQIGDYEELPVDHPEVQRFLNPSFSYRTWLKDQAAKDPILQVIGRRIAAIAGNTLGQELAEWEAICEQILPDP